MLFIATPHLRHANNLYAEVKITVILKCAIRLALRIASHIVFPLTTFNSAFGRELATQIPGCLGMFSFYCRLLNFTLRNTKLQACIIDIIT